jgi:hypothetical protein
LSLQQESQHVNYGSIRLEREQNLSGLSPIREASNAEKTGGWKCTPHFIGNRQLVELAEEYIRKFG